MTVRCVFDRSLALSAVAPALALSLLVAPVWAVSGGSAGTPGLFSQLDADADGLISPDEVPDDQHRLFDRLVRRSDKNGDGSLSAEEFAKGLTPDAPDKPMLQPSSGENRNANAVRVLLLKLDTNRDTRLVKDEIPEELASTYQQLVEAVDRNKDGSLDRGELSRGGPQLGRRATQVARRMGWDIDAELARLKREQGQEVERFDNPIDPIKAMKSPKQAASLFASLDSNGDRQLVLSEVPQPLQERFKRLLKRADRDRSGTVSEKEFVDAAGKLARFVELTDQVRTNLSSRSSKKPKPSSKGTSDSESMMANEPSKESVDASSEEAELIRRMVSRLDRNGDGVVERNEVRGQLARRFDRVDANDNGKLDTPELRVLAKRFGDRPRRPNMPKN